MRTHAAYLSICFLLCACATGAKETTLNDGSKGLIINCHGTANNWGGCYKDASQACPSGFEIKDKEEFVHEGYVKRNLYLKCK